MRRRNQATGFALLALYLPLLPWFLSFALFLRLLSPMNLSVQADPPSALLIHFMYCVGMSCNASQTSIACFESIVRFPRFFIGLFSSPFSFASLSSSSRPSIIQNFAIFHVLLRNLCCWDRSSNFCRHNVLYKSL